MSVLYGLQYFVGVLFWLNLMPDLTHYTILINQESGTLYTHVIFAEHVFLFVDIVQLGDVGIGIGEQRKGQTVLVSKFLVRVHIICAHSQYNNTALLHFVISVAEVTSLFCATRCVIPWTTGHLCELRSPFQIPAHSNPII